MYAVSRRGNSYRRRARSTAPKTPLSVMLKVENYTHFIWGLDLLTHLNPLASSEPPLSVSLPSFRTTRDEFHSKFYGADPIFYALTTFKRQFELSREYIM